MNSLGQVLDFILTIQIWDIAKVFVCFGLLLYLVFALIVLRQVGLMAKTLNVPIGLPIKTIAWLHLGLAVLVFLLSLVML